MNRETQLSLLFLLPDLSATGLFANGRVLAASLAPRIDRVAVCVLGRADKGRLAELESAGAEIASIAIRHSMDLGGIRQLRRLAREFRPSIIHAWGNPGVRAARYLVRRDRDGGNVPRLVVSLASDAAGGVGGWLATRQVRRADRVIPMTRADGERYRRRGVPVERLTLISPSAPEDEEPVRNELSLAPGARILVASSGSERGIGPRDAIVAFDMLRYDTKELHLVISGAGSEQSDLEQFGRSLAFDDYRIRFVAAGQDQTAAVQRADAVLVTNPRGVEEALEAMSAGKPVIGWQTPDISEIVDDKVTGVLVPPGDRGALAACTRAVLGNRNYARRLGEAGRARVADRFGKARMVEQFLRLYRELAHAEPDSERDI